MSFWFSGDIPLFCVCFMARRKRTVRNGYCKTTKLCGKSMPDPCCVLCSVFALIPPSSRFSCARSNGLNSNSPGILSNGRLCWPFMSCAPVFGRFDHREGAASNCPQERPKKKVPAQETLSLGPAQSFFIRGDRVNGSSARPPRGWSRRTGHWRPKSGSAQSAHSGWFAPHTPRA